MVVASNFGRTSGCFVVFGSCFDGVDVVVVFVDVVFDVAFIDSTVVFTGCTGCSIESVGNGEGYRYSS